MKDLYQFMHLTLSQKSSSLHGAYESDTPPRLLIYDNDADSFYVVKVAKPPWNYFRIVWMLFPIVTAAVWLITDKQQFLTSLYPKVHIIGALYFLSSIAVGLCRQRRLIINLSEIGSVELPREKALTGSFIRYLQERDRALKKSLPLLLVFFMAPSLFLPIPSLIFIGWSVLAYIMESNIANRNFAKSRLTKHWVEMYYSGSI